MAKPRKESYKINEAIIEDYYLNKKQKLLYSYATVVMLTAGYGYIKTPKLKEGLAKLCGISSLTADRWISLLKNNNLIRIRKGTVYPDGRKKSEQNYKLSKSYIRFGKEHLSSFSNFQNHVIRQIGLLLQNRFEYAFKELNKDVSSLVKLDKIETELARVKSRQQIGCSISKIHNKLDIPKSTISVALRGHTRKLSNCTKPIKGRIARVKYGSYINAMTNKEYYYVNPRHSYKYNPKDDTYELCYSLASRILVDSYILRRGS